MNTHMPPYSVAMIFKLINTLSKHVRLLSCVGISTCLTHMSHAQEPLPVTVASTPEKGALEIVFNHGHMSQNYGNAHDMALRGVLLTTYGVLQGEITQQKRFGFNGQYGALSFSHHFSPDYYAIVSTGIGNSELFPHWRVDTIGYHKLGAERQYVFGLGTYYAKGKDSERSDSGLLLAGIAYFPSFVIEGGLRINRAAPGSVIGPSQYVAATIGRGNSRTLIVRTEHAKEAYQVFPSGQEQVNYNSQTYSAQWREKISRDALLLIGVQYYKNPLYSKTSIETGLRWSFK